MNIKFTPRVIFHFFSFLVVWYFFNEHMAPWTYRPGDEQWGGQWRYLTKWTLVLDTILFTNIFLADVFDNIEINDVLLSTALPMNTMVLLLYWGLYAIDPSLVNEGGEAMNPFHEYYLHLGMIIIAWSEAFFVQKPYKRSENCFVGLLLIAMTYMFFLEFFVMPNNDQPCSKDGLVCGYPYPFLNDLSLMTRLTFYGAALAWVSFLHIFWFLLSERIWFSRMRRYDDKGNLKKA